MSRARDLSRLSSPTVFSVDATDASNNKVGVGSTTPTAKLNVAGIVSATSFFGDGSNLEGVASAGLGTALNSEVAGLDVIYYTDNVLSIGATITVDPPASTNIAYTQYAEVSVDANADLIIASGDDFVPDILGLSTVGVTPLTGAGGRIRADLFTNKAGTGAPNFPNGITVGGGAINDEKAHSGNAFLEQVYEIPHTINVTEDSTLDSLTVGGGAMMCKRREVIVNDSVSLIIADGEEFTINPLNL